MGLISWIKPYLEPNWNRVDLSRLQCTYCSSQVRCFTTTNDKVVANQLGSIVNACSQDMSVRLLAIAVENDYLNVCRQLFAKFTSNCNDFTASGRNPRGLEKSALFSILECKMTRSPALSTGTCAKGLWRFSLLFIIILILTGIAHLWGGAVSCPSWAHHRMAKIPATRTMCPNRQSFSARALILVRSFTT